MGTADGSCAGGSGAKVGDNAGSCTEAESPRVTLGISAGSLTIAEDVAGERVVVYIYIFK
jgi:hypothetical protein